MTVSQGLHSPIDPRRDATGVPASAAGNESWSAHRVLVWALGRYHPRIVLSASFGAPEGMVLLDMMHRIEPLSRVVFIDTGRTHEQTHRFLDRVRSHYAKRIEVVVPEAESVQKMLDRYGHDHFYRSIENRKLCCHVRKVEPLRRYLAGVDAYVTGLRRDQNLNRSRVRKIALDRENGNAIKINPLAAWTRERTLDYVREYGVPTNPLHAKGFPSVGCAPCTRAIRPGDDLRSGRWWWESSDERECGLHASEGRAGPDAGTCPRASRYGDPESG